MILMFFCFVEHTLFMQQTEDDLFTCAAVREKIKASAFEFRLAQLRETHKKALDAIEERLKGVLLAIPDDVKREKVCNFN